MRKTVRRRLGQHFLIDPVAAARLVDSLALDPGQDLVVEIGAGRGALTEFLTPRCGRLVAVELDYQLAAGLSQKFREYSHVSVVVGDFLKQELQDLCSPGMRLRIVGNIPYAITSAIILRILEPRSRRLIHDVTLTVQREVAERIVAKPGSKAYGVLSVLSQSLAVPEVLFGIPPRAFRPRPSVSSAVVRWGQFRQAEELGADEELFRRLLRSAFGQRRKMLRNGLLWLGDARLRALEALGWDLNRRPEELSPEEWLQLARDVSSLGSTDVGPAEAEDAPAESGAHG